MADVNINPKNPVINTRSFGEDPVNVANKVIAYARGLEDGGVLSVAKHFPGHGDTDVDSHKALPVLTFTRERLDSVELYPFKKVIEEGLGGIMVGHLEVPAFEKEPGLPSSLSRKVVYDLLMRELKFRGLVFTDALAMKGVSNNGSLCLKALKAGHDLLLVPRRIKEEVAAVLAAVKRGELSEQAIEEKCRKVLTYKYALGLNKKPMVRLSGLDMRINTPYTRDLIRRLNAAAITVLSNPTEVLPLDPDIKDVAVLNVGTAAEIQPFIKQLSEYTHPVEFRLEKDLSGAGRKALRDKLSKYKRILVCVTEQRLAAYQSFFAEFTPDTPVVYVFFIPGKQLLMTRGTLTTFSIANDVAKYFAIIPALFMVAIPQLAPLNIMGLHSPETAILSAIIFNAVIIPILIPLALRGVQYKPIGASALLRRNLLIYGLGGVIAPFIGIKLIDMFVSLFF